MEQSWANSPDWCVRLKSDGNAALAELFTSLRDRLRLAVNLRLDPRMAARIDPSDVLQEAYIEADRRLSDYLDKPSLPPHLWVRFLTMQQLQIHHRRHLGAQMREAGREVALASMRDPEVSSAAMALQLSDSGTSPSEAVQRAELRDKLLAILERLEPVDREVLALRHFEQLNNEETALVLEISPGTASQRYFRALRKVRGLFPGAADEPN